MGPGSGLRRAGRWASALLLVAVLAAVDMSAPVSAPSLVGSGAADLGVATGAVPVEAWAPSRAMGRPANERSAPRTPGVGDGGFCAITASGLSHADLALVASDRAAGMVASGVALRGMAGVRGPPPSPDCGALF